MNPTALSLLCAGCRQTCVPGRVIDYHLKYSFAVNFCSTFTEQHVNVVVESVLLYLSLCNKALLMLIMAVHTLE